MGASVPYQQCKKCSKRKGNSLIKIYFLLQLQPQQMMESGPPSQSTLSALLAEGTTGGLHLNSGDLSNLSQLLADRSNDLSDSLNRLSTSDLLPTYNMQWAWSILMQNKIFA